MPESYNIFRHKQLGFPLHAEKSLRYLSRVHNVYFVDGFVGLDQDLVSFEADCLDFVYQSCQDIEAFGDTLIDFFENFMDNWQN